MLMPSLFHATDQPWWPQWQHRTTPAAELLGMYFRYIELVRRKSVLPNFTYNLVAIVS